MSQKADDPIRIVPYDASWPHLFRELALPLRRELGDVALRIDHIGSTSISGLAAKPVIDLQISIADFEPLDAYRLPLERLGYVFHAENTERTKRFFREPVGQRRTHIHVRRAGSFSEQLPLLFRDFLRTHATVAQQYADLKIELARQYEWDRQAYTDAKQPFIWNVIAQADEWAQQIGWLPAASDV